MLHEVLLALSGHSSPIFEDTSSFPHVTPPENALLKSLGNLAALHRALKSHTARVAAEHPSNVCRAVANAIRSKQLSRFQKTILDVEKRILSSNPSHVGAYKVVPLASLMGDFKPWARLLEWLWELLCFIMPAEYEVDRDKGWKLVASGPNTIDRLRQECVTGYVEIEKMATDLVNTAETAWLRQLSVFLINNEQISWDFFIQRTSSRHGSKLRVRKRNLPNFVSTSAALSILHVAKASTYLDQTLRKSENNSPRSTERIPGTSDSKFEQTKTLSSLQIPISKDRFAAIIHSIRTSSSRQLTTAVLPSTEIITTIIKLQRFFLLQRVDFTDALVTQADRHIRNRHSQLQGRAAREDVQSLTSVTMTEGELGNVLSRTWTEMSAHMGRDQSIDPDLEWARENLTLGLVTHTTEDPTDDELELDRLDNRLLADKSSFNDFLLAAPTQLGLRLQPPLDLILNTEDLGTYTTIHAYLLSIRRAHLHLTSLWRHAALRRGAAFTAGPRSSYKSRMFASEKLRKRFSERDKAMRMHWATCSRSIYLLLELGEHLISQVGSASWRTFETWVQGGSSSKRQSEGNESAAEQNGVSYNATAPDMPDEESHEALNDPETIAQAHRHYLATLYNELMLDRPKYTRSLRNLLLRIDHFIALIRRLQAIQAKLDLADEGVDDGFSKKYLTEEQDVHTGLKDADKRVRASIEYLKDAMRTTGNDARNVLSAVIDSNTGFEPWSGGNIDRLLMRLDLSVDIEASPP